MKTTCAKLKKENDELRKRVDELETAVEEILWRLEAGCPAAASSIEKPKPSTKPRELSEPPRWWGRGLTCLDCGANPCDCNEKIWGYYFRYAPGDDQFYKCGTRSDAAEVLACTLAADRRANLERGPVQRESEPRPDNWSY